MMNVSCSQQCKPCIFLPLSKLQLKLMSRIFWLLLTKWLIKNKFAVYSLMKMMRSGRRRAHESSKQTDTRHWAQLHSALIVLFGEYLKRVWWLSDRVTSKKTMTPALLWRSESPELWSNHMTHVRRLAYGLSDHGECG